MDKYFDILFDEIQKQISQGAIEFYRSPPAQPKQLKPNNKKNPVDVHSTGFYSFNE